ncbi:MAG: FAD-dependent oxidoreductase [Acidobacteriota bacterium]
MRAALDSSLLRHLAERCRALNARAPRADGEVVLYWMRVALRGHENPALDVALDMAARFDRPVLVYQGLSERYPYASDRHHRFILEAARDVHDELAERGIAYRLHVLREGHRQRALAELAARSVAVVTEDMPVPPLDGWTRRLAERVVVPVLTVDTACVVPMQTVPPDRVDRAFRFRRITEAARRTRLREPWPEAAVRHEPATIDLPFEPVDPRSADVVELIGACDIDHSVGPIPGTRGGTRAGYARWDRFRQHGLRRYASDRNDPLRGGVSRMSAYLHYGMVSPLRIARDAAAIDGKGPEKYLDELLVWRELAYAFCFHTPHLHTLDAVPDWARETLRRHADDARPSLPSWETLARGRSGDPLWDAAQRSLLRHGELHNNVRMTWGKAFLQWADPARALAWAIDLNHRYALDGRDPASYGGILWCFGAFDRPFTPERPIVGSVRSRSTRRHAQRLDLPAYRARVERSPFDDPPSVLVVGAGLAGLACARTLVDAGVQVTVIDKGRGVGGRTATRRQDGHAFDAGAQFFTAYDPTVRRWVDAWRHDGLVAPWTAAIGMLDAGTFTAIDKERFVAVPGMRSLTEHLAAELDIRQGVRVERVERHADGWIARCADGAEPITADRCVLTAPPPQAVALLGPDAPLVDRLSSVEMAPCHAVLVAFAEPPTILGVPDFGGAEVGSSALGWVARDSSKPGRPAGERWVLHASPEWSAEHLDEPPDAVAEALLGALAESTATPLPPVDWLRVQRWRYARVTRDLAVDALVDRDSRLIYAGDGCRGSRVEFALTSGIAAAGAILTDC